MYLVLFKVNLADYFYAEHYRPRSKTETIAFCLSRASYSEGMQDTLTLKHRERAVGRSLGNVSIDTAGRRRSWGWEDNNKVLVCPAGATVITLPVANGLIVRSTFIVLRRQADNEERAVEAGDACHRTVCPPESRA